MSLKRKKKTALSLATALFPIAIEFYGNGDYIAGAFVSLVSVALFLVYDYYDDVAKEQPKLPLDAGDLAAIAEDVSAELSRELRGTQFMGEKKNDDGEME